AVTVRTVRALSPHVQNLSPHYEPAHLRAPHSFPTRRSSDLVHPLDCGAPGRPVPPLAQGRVQPFRQFRRALQRRRGGMAGPGLRSEEHTSELQSRSDLVCRLLLEKKKQPPTTQPPPPAPPAS